MAKAKSRLADDMRQREIGAIIWNIAEAGFHYIPEIKLDDPCGGKPRTVRVTGLYLYKGRLVRYGRRCRRFQCAELLYSRSGCAPGSGHSDPSVAGETLGTPSEEHGYTDEELPRSGLWWQTVISGGY